MNKSIIKKYFLFLLLSSLLLFLNPLHTLASEDLSLELTIAKGDCLINICKRYLEDPKKWREIAAINALKNPDWIYPGQKLIVPIRWLKGVPLSCEVTFLKGDVHVQKNSNGPWIPLRLGNRLSEGDSIQTGLESSVELTFEDGSTLFLRPRTLLKVELDQKKGLFHILRDFFVDVGKVFLKIKEATGTNSRHKIRTPSAVASARGTEFRVSVDSKGSTWSEVLKGKIEVEAMNQRVEIQQGEGTLVNQGKPPLPPRKLLPPPNPLDLQPIYKKIPIQLNFEQIKDVSKVKISVALDHECKNIVQETVIQNGETLQITHLRDATYYLFTQSIDAIGLEGPFSEPFVLKVRVNPLPPIIQWPHANTEFREQSIEIKWLKVEDAASYHIQVAEDPEFKIIQEEKIGIKDEFYQTQKLNFKTYYFRLRSIARDGYEGEWSTPSQFMVVPPPPSPILEKPETDKRTLQLRWRPGEGIKHFHFQMARDRGFKEILIDERIDQTSITIPKPKLIGIYYVRISSIDAEGYEGEFSKLQSFEIKPPSPPTIEKPLMDKNRIRLHWTSKEKEGDLNYHFQMAKDETFQNILLDQLLTQTSIDLEKPDTPGVYYVRVRGIDSNGNEGNFSNIETFEVKKGVNHTLLGVGTGILTTIGLILLFGL